MQTFVIPFEGKFLVYRPLIHVAFAGNRAMAAAAVRYTNGGTARVPRGEKAAHRFLERIGFLQPDPPRPVPCAARHGPTSAVLLMTNRCNLRCTYCYAAAGEKPPEDLSLELAVRTVDAVATNARQAGRKSFDLVFHGGGEPTQNWQVLKETVRHARRLRPECNIALSSNGVWSESQRDFLLGNLNGLSLSFDGTTEVQNAQRPTTGGRPSFRAVMKTVAALERRKFPYSVRMTWTGTRAGSLAESVRFLCTETGCRRLQVEPAFRAGRRGWTNPSALEADLFIENFRQALDEAEKHGADLMYAGARPWLTVCSFCTAAESALVVRPDGRLVACYEVTDARHPLASLFTIGRMSLTGPVFNRRAMQRLARMRQQRLSRCTDCFCVWHCGGDCSSRCFSADGTAHLRFDERCRINREISTEVLARYISRSGGVWHGTGPAETRGQ